MIIKFLQNASMRCQTLCSFAIKRNHEGTQRISSFIINTLSYWYNDGWKI